MAFGPLARDEPLIHSEVERDAKGEEYSMYIAETATESNVPQTAPFKVKTVSRVLEVAPAPASAALEHFSRKLEFETDCADVFASFVSQRVDFVLVDVRSEKLFSKSRVPGAINIPVLNITADRLKEFPPETLFVVYCAGPHCNGANKAAIRMAGMGRPVKEMIGGIMGWVDDGFTLREGR
jgi:rhodanese-related sulfurtransferase